MKTCKTCKYWGEEIYEHPQGKHFLCTNEKIDGTQSWDEDAIISKTEMYGLSTGPNFGCIHHAEVNPDI